MRQQLKAPLAPLPVPGDGGFTFVFGAYLDVGCLPLSHHLALGLLNDNVLASLMSQDAASASPLPSISYFHIPTTLFAQALLHNNASTVSGPTPLVASMSTALLRALRFNWHFARLDLSNMLISTQKDSDAFFACLVEVARCNVCLSEIVFPAVHDNVSCTAWWPRLGEALWTNPRPLLSSWSLRDLRLTDADLRAVAPGLLRASAFLPPSVLDLSGNALTSSSLADFLRGLSERGPAMAYRLQIFRLDGSALVSGVGDAVPPLVKVCQGC